jgi:hypothetical protein
MQLELSDDEAEALRRALLEILGELSSEIADTDNATYRKGLSAYRETLRSIQSRL